MSCIQASPPMGCPDGTSTWDEGCDFVAFVNARRASLHRWAWGMSGDWHQAEDLVQTTLVKLYQAWPRINSRAALETYAKRTMVRSHIDGQRRAWRRREAPSADLPDQSVELGPVAEADPRVWEALAALPERQRQVVVLRFVLDWSVADTAAQLGCSPGTVKSQSSRALARLRRHGLLHPASGDFDERDG